MNIREIAGQIDALKTQVQRSTQSYMLDADCTSVIDGQLNGYVRAIQSYCSTNNLIAIAHNITELLPIERNAIEFFCFWDGVKSDIVEHSNGAFGQNRLRIITTIAYELQSSMTKDDIDVYLSGFGVEISNSNYTVNSKRVYVENTLRNVDGIIIMNIAKDLDLFAPGVIDEEIEDKASSDYINQQISKCKSKMNSGDYDGNLPSLYKRVSKQINMYPDDSKVDNSINEILRGFVSIVNGLAGLSNNIGDRHASIKRPSHHHAKLAVNSSFVISDFLLESYQYQTSK